MSETEFPRRSVPLSMERKDARRLLSRLYADRYEDVEKTPITLEVPTDEAIEDLEERFPRVAKEFDHNE